MIEVQKHLSILGKRVRDRVTTYEGVATSVSFDLYGCIQVVVNPGLDKDRKPLDNHWFDINRLEILDKKPVMTPPDFIEGPVARGDKGPAEKPMQRSI